MKILHAAGSVLLFLCLTSTSLAQINISTPGTLRQAGQTYRLTGDVVAPGTAFTIDAPNIVLDLNGFHVTYNNEQSNSATPGIVVNFGADAARITNGYLVQGAGRTEQSHAIVVNSSGSSVGRFEISYLTIRTYSPDTHGIYGNSFHNSEVHHTYIRNTGSAGNTSGSEAEGITIKAYPGGVSLHDNIIVDSHRGVGAIQFGTSSSGASPSAIQRNLIQPIRTKGVKAPYGILLAKSRLVNVSENQIISDDGRGIILDGWSQGTDQGADSNEILLNKIDVQYSDSASSGFYVENNVYGIRDRYSSGDNVIKSNDIMVTNRNAGDVFGVNIGSDSSDSLMKNIVVDSNRIIVRRGAASTSSASVFRFSHAESIRVENNSYITDANVISHGGGVNNVANLIAGNNIEISTTSLPVEPPNGLQLTRFLDSYLLRWAESADQLVMEYIVYRDGQRLPISTRGGTFLVDTDVNGDHTYAVTAVSLAGIESDLSVAISTRDAAQAWSGMAVAPNPPTDLSAD